MKKILHKVDYAAFDKIKGSEGGQIVDKPNCLQVFNKCSKNTGCKLQVQQATGYYWKRCEGKRVEGAITSLSNMSVKIIYDNKAVALTVSSTITLISGTKLEDEVVPGAAQDVISAQKRPRYGNMGRYLWG